VRGTIRWFDEQRGYGYIQRADGKDVLVLQSDIEDIGYTSLYDGDEVEFEIVRDSKGHLKATSVIKV
jgi:CspA family cold shock protein